MLLKPGLLVMLTYDVWRELEQQRNSEAMSRLEMGAILRIVATPRNLGSPVLLAPAGDCEGEHEELLLEVSVDAAFRAREFFVHQKELERHGEGVSSPVYIGLWSQEFRALSPEEQKKLIKRARRGSWDAAWNFLTTTTVGFK